MAALPFPPLSRYRSVRSSLWGRHVSHRIEARPDIDPICMQRCIIWASGWPPTILLTLPVKLSGAAPICRWLGAMAVWPRGGARRKCCAFRAALRR